MDSLRNPELEKVSELCLFDNSMIYIYININIYIYISIYIYIYININRSA